MDKVIIVKNEDGGVFINFPNPKHFGEGKRDYANSQFFQDSRVSGKGWFLINHSDYVLLHHKKEDYAQFYHKDDSLQIDFGWNIRLMPPYLIKKRHIARINTQLDAALADNNPDPIKTIKLHREKEQCNNWNEKQWYEQAKKYIEEENINKPIILEKLNAKIAEIENRKN